MGLPVAARYKQIQHWTNPPMAEYRTIDDQGEPVVDGEVFEMPDFLTMTGQDMLDMLNADAIAKGLLPEPE